MRASCHGFHSVECRFFLSGGGLGVLGFRVQECSLECRVFGSLRFRVQEFVGLLACFPRCQGAFTDWKPWYSKGKIFMSVSSEESPVTAIV